ncbi:aminotransferase class I/II-fold pyridoxal phosphate-dependent enzyme [Fangia hongkongensis]|uniref:aminotransferase class I/II-fold pyridoxal phosphate-dependent enzyme n=1 Tax=Fangia hongkongensis TaxID=270495 RepID=UPI000368F273|nr:aminotransferase class I/II-fold pyridoxal phosphate-dependent enzyme [Fangia hongkongensis]MBK2126299.1 aminotransferase class I/II-fold pyridoxal phosphate-dependent enzyme [Fangia hongkongensis]
MIASTSTENELLLKALYERYQNLKAQNLSLDLTRGKPSKEQLSLSDDILTNISAEEAREAPDYRNYSTPQFLTGLPEAKKLFSDVLSIPQENIIIGGNSSLSLMYDTIIRALLIKLPQASKSWSEQGKIKFLCPTPGYDRHFGICEALGIEMINVPLTGHGPDMDYVEKLLLDDPQIKGMWCVPQYSNPTGEIYSDETVLRLARMKTAASDFRIFWDNAYAMHHLDFSSENKYVKNILKAAKDAGNPDRVFMYASTSKITYAGAGVAIIAANEANIAWFQKQLSFQSIGYDKINQLRHLKLLPSKDAFLSHMKAHAEILKPKFDAVDEILTKELGNLGEYATWIKPEGGYFISFNTQNNLAKKVVNMAAEAGVKLTKAGATFPYGIDPSDANIRIAPSLPSVDEIKRATEVLAVVTKIATLERIDL